MEDTERALPFDLARWHRLDLDATAAHAAHRSLQQRIAYLREEKHALREEAERQSAGGSLPEPAGFAEREKLLDKELFTAEAKRGPVAERAQVLAQLRQRCHAWLLARGINPEKPVPSTRFVQHAGGSSSPIQPYRETRLEV